MTLGFRITDVRKPLRVKHRAKVLFDKLDRISRQRSLTDLESRTLEDAMRELGMIS